jgi:hypothetical protein
MTQKIFKLKIFEDMEFFLVKFNNSEWLVCGLENDHKELYHYTIYK